MIILTSFHPPKSFCASRRLTKLFHATVQIFLDPTDEDLGNPDQMAKPPPLPTQKKKAALFLRDYHGFVDRMVKAKKVKISVPFYQQGDVVFEFNVSDFDSNRYLGKTQMTAR